MDGIFQGMQQPHMAQVRNGRLVLDEPTSLPEGTSVPLLVADGSEMSDEEREALDAALDESIDDFEAGRTVDAYEAIARARAGA